MKTLLFTLTLAVGSVSVANAQIYRPSVVGQTTVLGAVAGALIGGHNNDRWAEGAIIGAAAGAVVGAIADDSRPVAYGYGHYSQREIAPVVMAPCAPQVVYVNPAPAQIVYTNPYAYSRPVVIRRPVVYISPAPYSGGYYAHRDGYRRDRHDRRDYRDRHDRRW